MNDFFGMTLERIQEIQTIVEEIGLSLAPLHDAAEAGMRETDLNAKVTELAEAQLIAAAGLLARLDQGLGEEHFFAQGIQNYMETEELDMKRCTSLSRIVIETYGGMRDMQDPYAKSETEQLITSVLGASGLGDMLGGVGVVFRVVTPQEEPATEPVA